MVNFKVFYYTKWILMISFPLFFILFLVFKNIGILYIGISIISLTFLIQLIADRKEIKKFLKWRKNTNLRTFKI